VCVYLRQNTKGESEGGKKCHAKSNDKQKASAGGTQHAYFYALLFLDFVPFLFLGETNAHLDGLVSAAPLSRLWLPS
jgi:hypothetical protein